MLELKDPALLRSQGLIGERWQDADDGTTLTVVDPADRLSIATVPRMGRAETQRAIDAADGAWPDWRARTAMERAAIMRRWFDLMVANADDLALMMTTEQGKPLAEAKGEVLYAASFVDWFAEEGKRLYGETIRPRQAVRFWREGSRYGIEEYLAVKYVCIGGTDC